MITVKKGERTQVLHNDVQVAAFKANGWEVVETKTPAAPKGKQTGKGKGKQEPAKEPVQEPDKEPEQEEQGEPDGEPDEGEGAND